MKRLILCVLLTSTSAIAKPVESEAVKLVAACKELVSMYDVDGQEGQLAGWVTSVADAMQAGYCRGVVVEYRRNDAMRQANSWPRRQSCQVDDWLEQARVISSYSVDSVRNASLDRLLEASCGR